MIKNGLIILLFLLPVIAFAQYPNNPNKIRLGFQTTGNGLIYRGSGAPTLFPTGYNSAFQFYDTIANTLWVYQDSFWYLTNTIRRTTPPPYSSVSSGLTLVYGHGVWQDTDDYHRYEYVANDSIEAWVPATGTYYWPSEPSDIAATGTTGAVKYTAGLWHKVPTDSLFRYDGSDWVFIGADGSVNYLSGDAGTVQVISNGDTINIVGGYGMNTSAGATDAVTVTADTAQLATPYDVQFVQDSLDSHIALDGDLSATNEIQQIDTLSLSGTTLSASLSSDGTAAKTVNLSPLLSGYVTGSGTAGRVPRWTSSSALGDGVLRDDGTLLAIGGATVSGYSLYDYGTGGWRLPTGTTAQQPTGQAGAFRYNSTAGIPEYHNGTRWNYTAPSASAFTSTRIPFANANGQLTDDADFVWDATNNRLGLSVTPAYDLHIRRGTNAVLAASIENLTNSTASTSALQVAAKNTTDYVYLVNQSFSSGYTGTAWGGTYAANSAQAGRYSTTTAGKMIFYNVAQGGTTADNPIEFHITNNAVFNSSSIAASLTNTTLTTRNITSTTGRILYTDATPTLNLIGENSTLTPSFNIYSESSNVNRGIKLFQQSNNANGIGVTFSKSRGTRLIPSAVQSGDAIGAFSFKAYNGTAYLDDVAYVAGFMSGAVTTKTPISLGFVAGDTTSYNVDFLMHSGGNVGVGASGNGNFITTVNTPPRQLTVYGETRITDLTTDPPTRIVGADADGDLGAITVGAGLILSAGTLAATGTGTVTGSGTTDYIPKFTSSTALGNSVLQESSSKIGIGVTPAHTLDMENATDAIDLPGGTTAQRPTNESELLRYNSDNARVEYADGTNWRNLLPSTSTTGSAILPAGTTGERDGSPSNGYIRYNSTTGQLEAYVQSAWANISASPRSYADMVSSGAAQYTVVSTEVIDTVTNIVASGFTHLNGVLTYTGTTNKNFLVNISAVVGEADTDAATAVLRLYQNSSIKGVSQMYCALQDEKYSMSISRIVTLATNDTLDCRLATGGDWIVSNFYFNVTPID